MKLSRSFGFFQETNASLSSNNILCVAFLLLLLGSGLSFGQQWEGSTDATGNIHREGNVGIGTPQPQSKLHVAGGDITLDNRMSIIFKNAAGQNDGTRISRFGSSASKKNSLMNDKQFASNNRLNRTRRAVHEFQFSDSFNVSS